MKIFSPLTFFLKSYSDSTITPWVCPWSVQSYCKIYCCRLTWYILHLQVPRADVPPRQPTVQHRHAAAGHHLQCFAAGNIATLSRALCNVQVLFPSAGTTYRHSPRRNDCPRKLAIAYIALHCSLTELLHFISLFTRTSSACQCFTIKKTGVYNRQLQSYHFSQHLAERHKAISLIYCVIYTSVLFTLADVKAQALP